MKNSIIFILCSFIFLHCCDINNQRLLLINNAADTIYYSLLTNTKPYEDLYLYELPSYDSTRPNFVRGGKGAWEYSINRESKDSTLQIFIFDTNKLSQKMLENHDYVRKGFKINELDSLNWIVNYPDDFE